jgi:TPR repeat protein
MPVSFLPLLPLALAVFAAIAAMKASTRRSRSVWVLVMAAAILGWPTVVYIHGLVLYARASDANPGAQLRYAKWLENHAETINTWMIWPAAPDVESGFKWVRRAAWNGDPEAMYALGTRLKYSTFVPELSDADLPHGTVFQVPADAQIWIDRAIAAGYKPPAGFTEQQFYFCVYRR